MVPPMPSMPATGWASLLFGVTSQLARTWKAALDEELGRQVRQLYRHAKPKCTSDCYRSWETLAQVRAAMGYKWMPRERKAQLELSMDRLFSEESLKALSPAG